MDYLLKASAILGIFYLFYRLVLHKETFFQSNRIFLLIGIITSLFLPLIVIPIYAEQTVLPIQDFVIAQSIEVSEIPQTINWAQIIGLGYITGVLFFGTKFLLSLVSLCKILINSKKEKVGDFYFIKSKNSNSPFSFFNYIVYNPNSFQQNELAQILIHEKVHAYQWHSFDVLFSQFTTIIFWFNPISWLYKNVLQQNLEFIADAVSQEKSPCQKSYQQLLLKTSISPNKLALTNNFYNSLIKKRIIMLHKNRSKNTNQWKFTFILPLLAAFIFTFNTKTIAQTVVKTITTTDDNYGLVIEEMEDNMQMMVIITKDSNQDELDNIKATFSKEGVSVKFKKIKRNSSNEITAIKIDVKSKQSSANFNTNSVNSIKPIKISFDKKGNHIAIGNVEILHGEQDMIFVSSDKTHKINTSVSSTPNFVFISDDDNFENFMTKVVEIENGSGTTDENIWITSSNDSLKREIKIINIVDVRKENSKVLLLSDDNDGEVTIIVNGEKISTEAFEKMNTDEIKNVEVIQIDASEKGSKSTLKILTKGDAEISYKVDKLEYFPSKESKNLLYFVDGKEINKDAMEKINPDDIKQVNVLKGNSAIKKYGKKGIDGVIEITTKKK